MDISSISSNSNQQQSDFGISETIEQKLEQNEKIIQICVESLPHLNNSNTSSSTTQTQQQQQQQLNQSPNSSSMPLFPVAAERPQQPASSPATTPTTPSSTLTHILKLFAKQLLTLKLCNKSTHSELFNRHPSLKIWLKVLNVWPATIEKLTASYNFHELYEKTEIDLKNLLRSSIINANEQDCNIICNAFQSLKSTYKSLEKTSSTQQYLNSGVQKQLKPKDELAYQLTPPAAAASVATANSSSHKGATTTSSNSSSTTTSSSSILLNTSNSNESQLSSPSCSSINNETNVTNNDNCTTNNTSSARHSERELISKPKKLNLGHIESPTIANLMVTNNTINAIKKLEQRKSESDAPSQNSIAPQLLSAASIKSGEFSNNSISTQPLNNSSQVSKIITFSPTIPTKSTNKKSTGLKVTTPPASRKLSTGPFSNVINVNSQQIQAAAAAAIAVKVAAAQAQAAAAASTTLTSSESNTDADHHHHNQNTIEDNQIIQRSSSHESHLRNKITINTNNLNKQGSNSNLNNKANLINGLNSTFIDYCGEHRHLSSSMASTPTTEVSTNDTNLLSSSTGNKNKTLDRRSSVEGSDCSSRGPSGQASPINAQSPTRLNSGVKLSSGYPFLTDEYYKNNNLSIPKSPKQTRDHRWKNTFKVANCGVCNKKMIIGIKCKACKFRCHKECEKKCTQPCSSSIISNLPHLPPSGAPNLSPCESNNDLINQNHQQQQQQQLISNQASNISSSSSTTSSNVPSPAIVGYQADDNQSQQHQHAWPSSKVARVAKQIVQTINSVSTPKQSHRQLQPLDAKNLPESRSDSSCNSSGPNSPNYKLSIQQQKQYYSGIQLPTQLNGNDKKSTSSSSSISSQYGSANVNNTHVKSSNVNQALTPIQSNTNSLSSSQNTNKNVEFFPPLSSPTPIITKTDDQTDTSNKTSVNESENKFDDKTTKEVRESLKLALKNVSNNLNVSDSSENVINSIGDISFKSSMYDNNEYESNDAESNQLSFSQDFKQFNITYEEITDKVEIGRGRFGTVYKAYWHGPHAIKEIDFDENLTESSEELKSFKEEVLNLRQTRHTNLILFVGSCIKPPKCAILMSLCRGVSLYKYIHIDAYSKPTFDWTIDIATQIAQGMGYLHNRQMIHKDLRSKNIFIDGCKAVITDFGLYSITRLGKKLKRKDLLPITKECIYYMAPELVRLLGTNEMETNFSQASDVFSFGTVWYELFCYEYPFTGCSTENLIYSIGNGLKNITPNIQIPREFKTILLKCWSKDPSNRHDFSRLLETFRAIPKRTKIFRSPSHPGHIGRSLETLHTPMNDMKN